MRSLADAGRNAEGSCIWSVRYGWRKSTAVLSSGSSSRRWSNERLKLTWYKKRWEEAGQCVAGLVWDGWHRPTRRKDTLALPSAVQVRFREEILRSSFPGCCCWPGCLWPLGTRVRRFFFSHPPGPGSHLFFFPSSLSSLPLLALLLLPILHGPPPLGRPPLARNNNVTRLLRAGSLQS